LLRPMCAKNLPLTLPEIEGWVDREKLHGITGRSRKPQITMAKEFGIEDYSQPAGGCCFLTDKYYSAKLVDLWKSHGHKDYELDDVMLLKVGRHIRPKKNFKLIIAREEGEGRFLEGYKKEFISLHCSSHTGPLALIDGSVSAEDLYLAASVVARYGQGRNAGQVDINVTDKDGSERTLQVKPLKNEEILKEWYV
jgi:tRNA-specific 2-thiouridylase